MPVPDGFHVITGAYERFVVQNGLRPFILETLQAIDADQPDSLHAASRAIRESFDQVNMPQDIAAAIAQAYAHLPGESPAVAVRSSATAEDLPHLSFAGQQDSFLYIVGAAAQPWLYCGAGVWHPGGVGHRFGHQADKQRASNHRRWQRGEGLFEERGLNGASRGRGKRPNPS